MSSTPGPGAGHSSQPAIAPFDLPALRQWLSSLASQYQSQQTGRKVWLGRRSAKDAREHAAELKNLRDTFEGFPAAVPVIDTLRRFLAIGTVQYVTVIGRIPCDMRPDQVVGDVLTFALWEVARAEKLPEGWEVELARISSPRMAYLVADARGFGAADNQGNFQAFAQLLGSRTTADGAFNLLSDLGDSRAGGAALTALALAAKLPAPVHQRKGRTVIIWLFAALGTGAAGAEGGHAADAVNRIVEDAWDWLANSGAHHSGVHKHAADSSKDTLADEIISHLFHH
jgi:hypothetical protein